LLVFCHLDCLMLLYLGWSIPNLTHHDPSLISFSLAVPCNACVRAC